MIRTRGVFFLLAGFIVAWNQVSWFRATSPASPASGFGLIVIAPYLFLAAGLILFGVWKIVQSIRTHEHTRPHSMLPLGYVLALVAVAFYGQSQTESGRRSAQRAQRARCHSASRDLATALSIYATDNQGLYPARLAELTPNYLKTIPNCRTSEDDPGIPYRFTSTADHKHYDLTCGRLDHPRTTENGQEEAKD